jgi:5-methyltetrahydrofolate--homocysteine methyltransferase
VVKSARVMKKSVAYLTPFMEAEKAAAVAGGCEVRTQGKVLMATVKGDVHDIGKNIVGVVLGCNNYEVIDLGVMVSCETILKAAQEHQVDVIGLSGLITPSLDEMAHVAREMERLGMRQPLLIGGATTSKAHTAIKLAPGYSQPVIHVLDASRAVPVVSNLINPDLKGAYVAQIRDEYQSLRSSHAAANTPLLSLEQARSQGARLDFSDLPHPESTGVRVLEDVPLETLRPYIDWSPFFHTWELRGRYPAILQHEKYGEEARKLFTDAQALLDDLIARKRIRACGVYGIFPANRDGDSVQVYTDNSRSRVQTTFHMLRQQVVKEDGTPQWSLADFVAPKGAEDHVGAFAVTTGIGLDEVVAAYKAAHDDYNAIMAEALADRLAEAFAEYLHQRVRKEWGYGSQEQLSAEDLIEQRYRGIRPAGGYPASPDHTEKQTLWTLLDVEAKTGIRLTESCAMWPGSSVSGLYFAHPQSKYFGVGKLGRDQVTDLARRKSVPVAEMERWLGPWLAYEPSRGS